MLLFPAIDLMGGQVVRLRQGLAGQKTVYPGDPADVARRWQDEGGHYLHVVDLDAAFSGSGAEANRAAIARITRAVTIPVELGGGMRTGEAARAAFDLGISRIIIGTRAAESMEFVAEMAAEFGPARVAVGIDARDGVVAVKGWTQSAGRRAIDVAREAQSAGAGALIYTDIATDGMLAGPNFAELKTMLDQLTIPLIASGGVTTAEDVRRLAAWPKLYGVIIGRALYEETLRLADCLPWVN